MNAPFDLQQYVLTVAHNTILYFIMFSFGLYFYLYHRTLVRISASKITTPVRQQSWLNLLYIFLILRISYNLVIFIFKTYFKDQWFAAAPILRFNVDILFFLSCALITLADNYLSYVPKVFTFALRIDPTHQEVKGFSATTLLDELKDSINSNEIKKCAEGLRELIDKDKIYTRAHIDEEKLTGLLNVNREDITTFFSHYLKMSFSQFLIVCRVEEAKKMLRENNGHEIKMTFVAHECGFNSDSAFYANFKSYTGMTPSTYRRINNSIVS